MSRVGSTALIVGLLASLTACTEKNPLFCGSDSECSGPRPICDITGEFEGTANVCIATPDDCPIERCGCEPGESFTCDGDQLTSCAEDGKSTVTSTCSLGCSTENRCLTFEPSNGLAEALAMSANEPDVVLPQGARIDTTTGTVQDASGAVIPVTTVVVEQDGGSSIRAFLARSWILDAVRVTGSRAIAFIAHDSIAIRGVLDASADGDVSGPGGQESPAVCVGASTTLTVPGCTIGCNALGGGGGGNAMNGAVGGGLTGPGGAGGALIPTFVPLVGGCRGGTLVKQSPSVGGAGGGSLQLVAGVRVELLANGSIDAGGGGGASSAGGGSGGTIVIETPVLQFIGSSTGIFANGGSGGGCGLVGEDARRSLISAVGPRCDEHSAGDGGTASFPPTNGRTNCPPGATCAFQSDFQGGGGGSVGRLLTITRDGDFSVTGTPTFGAVTSKAKLITN